MGFAPITNGATASGSVTSAMTGAVTYVRGAVGES